MGMSMSHAQRATWPHLEHLLVGVELDKPDAALLDYVEMLIRRVRVGCVRFVHVIPPVSLYYNTTEHRAAEWGDVDDGVVRQMKRKLHARFDKYSSTESLVDVRVGDPLEELLLEAESYRMDLLVIGQSAQKAYHAILAKNLARQAACDVLVVPENAKPEISRILVPIDFSDSSAEALRRMSQLATLPGREVEIECVHVFDMPGAHWHRIQRTEEEVTRMLEEDRRNALEAFIKKHTDVAFGHIHSSIIRQLDGGIGKHIIDQAHQRGIDLIAMGAMGHSRVHSLLLGSVAERVMSMNSTIPVYLIR